MKRMRYLIIGCWAFILTGMIFHLNPFLLSPQSLEQLELLNAFQKPPFLIEIEPLTTLKKETSVYRENLNRTGQSILKTSLKIQEAWHSPIINFSIHSASKSSPSIDESGIYVGSDTGWIYAYNHDGTLRWKFLTTSSPQGVHGSAALDEEFLYIGSYNGRLYCLEKATGKVRWITKLAHAIGDVPLLYKDALFVAAEYSSPREGKLYKIDRKTGRTIWASEDFHEQVHSSPTLDPSNNLVFVGNNNHEMRAFSMETGQSIWRFSAPGPIKGTAAFHQGRLYFTTWEAKAFCLNAGTGELIWEADLDSFSQSSPTLIPEYDIAVFASHREKSHLYGLQMSTGKILWKQSLRGNLEAMGSGIALRRYDNQKWLVWIQCFSKTLCAVEPKDGKILKQIELTGELTNVPAFDKKGFVVSLNRSGIIRFNYLNEHVP